MANLTLKIFRSNNSTLNSNSNHLDYGIRIDKMEFYSMVYTTSIVL